MLKPSCPASGERGSALLVSFFVVILLFGLVGSMTLLATTYSRANQARLTLAQAFYLSEAGLEGAKWELATGSDPDGDGVGDRKVETGEGTYTVSVTDNGDGTYTLVSTGSASGDSATIEETVQLVLPGGSGFPASAMTMVGGFPGSGIQIKQGVYGPSGSRTLIIDGGNSPGIALIDTTTYSEVGDVLSNAVLDGDLDLDNLTGSVANEFNGVDLPLEHYADSEEFLDELAGAHTEMTDHIADQLLTTAKKSTISSASNIVYGAMGSHEQFYFPNDEVLTDGQTLTGYGTLIVNKKFQIENGATFNWNGDLIIFGNESSDSELEVDGQATVTGTILVLGQAEKDSKLTMKTAGQLDVTGSITSISDPSTVSKTMFITEGTVNLNGVLSILGPTIQTEFKDTSETNITGTIQIGAPAAFDDFLLKFEGDFEVHKDDDGIAQGADALRDLNTSMGLTQGGAIFFSSADDAQLISLSWAHHESTY